jgi:hypothetical protein
VHVPIPIAINVGKLNLCTLERFSIERNRQGISARKICDCMWRTLDRLGLRLKKVACAGRAPRTCANQY